MSDKSYILVETLCTQYEIEPDFFVALERVGLIRVQNPAGNRPGISEEELGQLEKIIRLHHDLHVNPEGIDVIFNLLERIQRMDEEVNTLRRRLRLYE